MSKQIGQLTPNNNQRLRVYDVFYNAPTLNAGMGMGGGVVPLIVIDYDDDKVCEDKTSNR